MCRALNPGAVPGRLIAGDLPGLPACRAALGQRRVGWHGGQLMVGTGAAVACIGG
jgi:hypothetical protein